MITNHNCDFCPRPLAKETSLKSKNLTDGSCRGMKRSLMLFVYLSNLIAFRKDFVSWAVTASLLGANSWIGSDTSDRQFTQVYCSNALKLANSGSDDGSRRLSLFVVCFVVIVPEAYLVRW